MPRKKRTILSAENIKLMDRERQRTLVVFRTVLTQVLKDMVHVLHLLQPIQADEEFQLELLSACGFTGRLTLQMDDYGDCPTDDAVAEALKETTMAMLKDTKGAIMHGLSDAESLEDVEEALTKVMEHRKDSKSKSRQKLLDSIRERVGKRSKKPSSDPDLQEIEAMLDEVVTAAKKPKPPKPPDPTKEYGFLG